MTSSVPEDLTRPLSTAEAEKLNTEILACHRSADFVSLAEGYRRGGWDAELRGDPDAACFFFTQAYVFALRAGLPDLADELWSRLEGHGREA